MKRILFFSFVSLIINNSFGQLDFKTSLAGRTVEFADLNGRSLLKKYDPEIAGTPFINDNWVFAKLTLSRGKEIGPLQIKLNIESNELHYLDSIGKEMIAAEGVVKKIDCINYYSKDSIKYVFGNGYPRIDDQNESYYYQIFTDGKIELLAKKFKYVRTVKDEVSGEISKDFIDGSVVLYVYAYSIIQTFHPTKTFISSLWDEGKGLAMDKFIEVNKINFKKTPDLIKLFNYYNSLE